MRYKVNITRNITDEKGKYVKNTEENLTDIDFITWSDDLDKLTISFEFQSGEEYNCGDAFELLYIDDNQDEQTVLVGIITDVSRKNNGRYLYMGFDCGYYLSRNKIIEQYFGADIKTIIEGLCRNYKFKIGDMTAIENLEKTKVNATFKNITLLDAFNDIKKAINLYLGVNDVYITFFNGAFNLYPYMIDNNLSGEISDMFTIDSRETMHQTMLKNSIDELRNQIIITDEKNKQPMSKPEPDENSIQLYGLMQSIEDIKTITLANTVRPVKERDEKLEQVAKNRLNELNQPKETIEISMLGNYQMKQGVIFDIKNPEVNLEGRFLIRSSEHQITSSKEVVKVTLQKANI